MRPLFAIAPLALGLALLGPSSRASPTESSWGDTLIAWMFTSPVESNNQAAQLGTGQSFETTIRATR